jgi:hypothetical protein
MLGLAIGIFGNELDTFVVLDDAALLCSRWAIYLFNLSINLERYLANQVPPL